MYAKATNTTLSENVVSQICNMILEGDVKKGELLPSESQLCSLFEVSRTTVRRALQTLAEENIIRTEKGKGSFVISDNFTFLNDGLRAKISQYKGNLKYASQARYLIEPQIAYNATLCATKRDIIDLQAILELCRERQMDGTLSTEDLRMFHLRLADTLQNPVIVSMVELLISMCDSPQDTQLNIPNPDIKEAPNIIQEHQDILDAIIRHSPRDAFFLMQENLGTFEHNCFNEFEWANLSLQDFPMEE